MAKKNKMSLYLNENALHYLLLKFNKYVTINMFSNKYVIYSKNCINRNIPYLVGEFNGIAVNETWNDERQNFSIFIISREDFNNALIGDYSEDVIFFINKINQRQTLKDISNNKVTADIFLILEEDFIEYYKNRENYISYKKTTDFEHFELFKLMSKSNNSNLF